MFVTEYNKQSETRFSVKCEKRLFKKKSKYPVLKLKTASSKLVVDCHEALRILGINSNIACGVAEIHSVTKRQFITNYLYINGRSNLKKCTERICFNNPKTLIKIEKWAQRDSNLRDKSTLLPSRNPLVSP